jgi:hypothetical protein
MAAQKQQMVLLRDGLSKNSLHWAYSTFLSRDKDQNLEFVYSDNREHYRYRRDIYKVGSFSHGIVSSHVINTIFLVSSVAFQYLVTLLPHLRSCVSLHRVTPTRTKRKFAWLTLLLRWCGPRIVTSRLDMRASSLLRIFIFTSISSKICRGHNRPVDTCLGVYQ